MSIVIADVDILSTQKDHEDMLHVETESDMDFFLLDNQELLHNFINNEENRFVNKEAPRRPRFSPDEGSFRPDEAFMNIGFNLRAALKKHLPLGILQVAESITT